MFCFTSQAVFGASVEHPLAGKTLTLSYVNHPVIVKQIIPLVQRAYLRLGIDVDFVEQPSKRNLRLASSGITDGEVAYSDLLVQPYANLLLVGPEFFESIFVLLCHRSEPCDKGVLYEEEKTIVLTDASRDGLESVYQDKLSVGMYSINSLKRIPRLIDGRRLVYGIYVTTEDDTSLADYPELTYVELFRTKTHHVLNEKHATLATHVAKALQQEMERAAQNTP